MKIYEFKFSGGETDWVLAPNMKEAKEFYLNFTGCGDLTNSTVRSVPKKEWDTMYLLDINDSDPYDEESEDYNEDDYSCGYRIIETMKEYAERETCTDLIATTEF